MRLDTKEWKRFYLSRLFEIKKGKRLTAEDQEDGVYNYIGAIDSNNGIANHISQKPIHDGNTISLSYNGSVGEAFYQPEPYWATDDVNALYSRYNGFNEHIGLFFASVIRQEKYRFSYGRKWTMENMKATEICLPVQHNADGSNFLDFSCEFSDEGYVPDWQFMEDYIKSLHFKPLTTCNKVGQAMDLNVKKWKEFRVGDILSCESTKLSIKDELLDGKIPFVSRTAENNGVDGYVDVENDKITEGNCLTIGAEGIYAFYQFEPFATGNKVYQLRKTNMNTYIGLFLSTLLNLEDFRYSYGRARIMNKLKEEVVKLPVDENGNPDWQFMEDYIKSLPYGDRLEG